MTVELQPTFDAVEVFWFKQRRLYSIFKLQDAYTFAYVGNGEAYNKPLPHYAFLGLAGFFLDRRAKRRQERLRRDADEMRTRIAAAKPNELLQLHPLNFRIETSEIADSQILGSIFYAGYGTFWRFRQKSGDTRTFRIDASPAVIEEVKQLLLTLA
jgi:hypothetical protein